MAEKTAAPGAALLTLNNTTDTNDQDLQISHVVFSCTTNYGLYQLEDNQGHVVARYRTTVFDPTGVVPVNRMVRGGVKVTSIPLAGSSEIDVHLQKELRIWL